LDFKVGDIVLDKYEITGVLGKGGMGLVLAARHREHRELVALKVLLPALRDKPELCARFAREARAGIRIKSPHVARVYDVDTVDGVPFMVMEHLTGQDLAAVIHKRGPLPVEEAADLLLQACEPVNEAHALGIVHRDLKPGNLFLTTAADGLPFIKVLDFGISKTTVDDDVSVTASHAVLGSPLYMSPEQLASSRSVDARSDVWSLGVMLYEMLAGKAPFSGDSFPMICAAILGGSYPRLSEARPEVPPELERLVSEALVTDREDRLPTVEAFAVGLAPFGTEAGRASCARIQRLAARARAVSAPGVAAGEAGDAGEAGTAPPAIGDTAVPPPGQSTTAGFTRSPSAGESVRDRPSSRKLRNVALAAAAVAASTLTAAAVAPRLSRWRASSPASASGARADLADAGAPPECASGATAACKAACEGGSPAACNALGRLYAQGEGVARDDAAAVSFYARACDLNYPIACVNLGAQHFEGSGVPKNESLGARFFLRGCEAGVPQGCLDVSIAYAQGRGVPKDPGQAWTYADRACGAGLAAGCVRLGLARMLGEGVAKDVKAGLAQLDGMCTRGEPEGCEALAHLYATGSGRDVVADPLRVRDYRKKACDLGSTRSCTDDKLLGTMDTSESTAARANALFQSQCDAGSFVACGLLGENLLTGNGTSVDPEKGKALLTKACAGGFDRACKRLAEAKGD
jgi:serine/threonine-protein kinase